MTFQSKTLLAKVKVANLSLIKEMCLSIAPPKNKLQGAHRLFPQEPLWPLRSCQEWAVEVVEALVPENVIYQEGEEW